MINLEKYLMSDKAIILFAHGARAEAWAKPFRRLQHMLQTQKPELRGGVGVS